MHRYRALVPFLRRHGADLFAEVRAAYVDTLSRVLSSHFRAYLAALDAAKVPPILPQTLALHPSRHPESQTELDFA